MSYQKIAKEIVTGILDDLTDRNGLKDEWCEINDDTKKEIIDKWRQIVYQNLIFWKH